MNIELKADFIVSKILGPKPSVPIVPTPLANVAIALIDFNCCGNLKISSTFNAFANTAKAAIPPNASLPKPPVASSFVGNFIDWSPLSFAFNLSFSASLRASCSLLNLSLSKPNLAACISTISSILCLVSMAISFIFSKIEVCSMSAGEDTAPALPAIAEPTAS